MARGLANALPVKHSVSNLYGPTWGLFCAIGFAPGRASDLISSRLVLTRNISHVLTDGRRGVHPGTYTYRVL